MGRIYQLFNVINQAIKDKGIFYVIKRAFSIWIYFVYYKLFSEQKILFSEVNRIAIFMTSSITRG